MSILGLYFIAFIGLIALSMPIAFALGFSTFAVFWIAINRCQCTLSAFGLGATNFRWSRFRFSFWRAS